MNQIERIEVMQVAILIMIIATFALIFFLSLEASAVVDLATLQLDRAYNIFGQLGWLANCTAG